MSRIAGYATTADGMYHTFHCGWHRAGSGLTIRAGVYRMVATCAPPCAGLLTAIQPVVALLLLLHAAGGQRCRRHNPRRRSVPLSRPDRSPHSGTTPGTREPRVLSNGCGADPAALADEQ